jgi:ABC-type transport system involved in cytochrome c biogenesis permease subunit
MAITAFLFLSEPKLLRGNRVVLAGGSFAAFVFLAILSSPIIDSSLHPPVPVLRSSWLVLHVAFAFVGLALFTVGMVAGVVGLTKPDAERVDAVRDRSIVLGFVFYVTGGLVFGAIWAEAAWGRYWGWDPKETWALVTSVVYAGYLHLRYLRWAKDGASRTTAPRIMAIVAWAVAIFTFFGVNYLFTGLHAYA